MELNIITLSEETIEGIEQLLQDSSKRVMQIAAATTRRGRPLLFLLTENKEAELELQKEELKRLKAVAAIVANDSKYKGLKNAKQRQLFLLENYNVEKHDADTLAEIIKMGEIQEENGASTIMPRETAKPNNQKAAQTNVQRSHSVKLTNVERKQTGKG